MLKVLGIAVLVSVLAIQTDSHTDKAKQGQSSQQPTAPVTPSGLKDPDRPSPQIESQKHIPNDVWIVRTPDKDKFDITTLVVSIVLALVGTLGVAVGWATVLYIKRQAFEMGHQRIVMRRTLNTMRRQGEIQLKQLAEMRLQREQAEVIQRARITIDHTATEDPDETEPVPGIITITSQGPAYAFNVSCRVNCFASRDRELKEVPKLYTQSLPTVLKALDQHKIQWEQFSPLTDDRDDDGPDPVRAEKAFLHIYVIVSYRDIFGEMPDSVLHLLWNVDIETIRYPLPKTEEDDEEYTAFGEIDHSRWIPANPTPNAN